MIYSFGNTVLDEHRRALYRGSEWIMVEPKVFDVLLYLVKNRDRVVTRQELLEACWPNIYVSDGTLSRCVSRVRQAVDQARSATRPIFTLHGKGYRFVDDVSVNEHADGAEAAPAPEEKQAPAQPSATEAERRVISVVDCALDLQIARNHGDAESLYDALEQFTAICCDVARRYGGTYCKPTCEGAELRFGEPSSVERAAESAVLAGFELIERARELGMTARVGVASGRAIVKPTGEGAGRFSMVVEIDPLRPACLRAGAAAGHCVADDSTRQLVEAGFVSEALGTAQVLGGEVPVFRLTPRLVALAPCADDMPFFGRSSELAFLEHCWRYAAGGQGQTVNLRGAMGVGKTRLVQELIARVDLPAEAQLRVQCSPHHRELPFYPLALLLRDLVGGKTVKPAGRTAAVNAFLKRLGLPAEPHAANLLPLLSALLSVGKSELAEVGAAPQREAVAQTLAAVILAAAAQQPSILWVDDIQWADAASLEVVEAVRGQAARHRLLVVLAGRPDVASRGGEAKGATSIILNPFSQSETRRLLNARSDGAPLSAQLIDWIVERSDGVPLFLREILRMALQDGSGKAKQVDRTAIPQALQWQLQSLLDEAGEAKQVAQWAALLGRTFTSTILAAATKVPGDRLQAQLEHLIAIGLLSEAGCGRNTSFRFNHDLVHDFACDSLLGRQRRERHRIIADTLIAEFPHIAAHDPETVAGHLEASDMPERAREYRKQAGRGGWNHGAATADAAIELLTALPAAGRDGKPACGPRRRVA